MCIAYSIALDGIQFMYMSMICVIIVLLYDYGFNCPSVLASLRT